MVLPPNGLQLCVPRGSASCKLHTVPPLRGPLELGFLTLEDRLSLVSTSAATRYEWVRDPTSPGRLDLPWAGQAEAWTLYWASV